MKYSCSHCSFRSVRKARYDVHIKSCFNKQFKIISLGESCVIREMLIDKQFSYNGPTNFFDWFFTFDFSFIIGLLYYQSFIDTYSHEITIDNSTGDASHVNAANALWIHDLHANPSDSDINDFFSKYERRYQRLIEIIKNNNKICFVRFGMTIERDKKMFFSLLRNINPKIKVMFCEIVDWPTDKTSPPYVIKHHDKSENGCGLLLLNINARKFPSGKKPNGNWRKKHIDWSGISSVIKQNSRYL